jgi:hypothetical protein
VVKSLEGFAMARLGMDFLLILDKSLVHMLLTLMGIQLTGENSNHRVITPSSYQRPRWYEDGVYGQAGVE